LPKIRIFIKLLNTTTRRPIFGIITILKSIFLKITIIKTIRNITNIKLIRILTKSTRKLTRAIIYRQKMVETRRR
jgi:hypothetical protein